MGSQAARLRELRLKAGFKSARSAAIAMGWNPTTYASHENGHRPLTEPAANTYAVGFKVSPVFLLTGLEPEHESAQLIQIKQKHLPLFTENLKSDIYAFVLRGTVPKGLRSYTMPDPDGILDASSFAYEITGDDMINRPPTAGERSFNPGDIVIIAPKAAIRAGDYVLCRIKGGVGILLRKWRPIAAAVGSAALGDGILEPLNANYQPVEVAVVEAEAIGRVVKHIQSV